MHSYTNRNLKKWCILHHTLIFFSDYLWTNEMYNFIAVKKSSILKEFNFYFVILLHPTLHLIVLQNNNT